MRYFDTMQYAMNSLVGNADNSFENSLAGGSHKLSDTTNGSAVVTLLDNITAGAGFRIGTIYKSATASGASHTKVTLDLNDYTYTFATPLSKDSNAGINKNKGIQISKGAIENSQTAVTIKNGTMNIAEQTTGGELFERMIRSYTDLTLENVTLDGRNVKKQDSGEDGAVLCHSVGTLTLSGNTSILVQEDTTDKTYYAVSGKQSGANGDYLANSNTYYSAGFTINVETTGKDRYGNDSTIKNIGIFGWDDGSQTSKTVTGASYKSRGFTADNAKLNIKSGSVGDVTFSKNSVNVLDATLANNFSLGGGTSNVELGSFEYDAESGKVLYQKADGTLYTLAQTNSWNAVSTADNNKAYNYIVADTDTSNKGGGKIALNVTGVSDKADLAFDGTHSIFGIPKDATASGDASGYKFAYLDYDKNKEAVTISGASADAVITEKESSLASAVGILANTVKKIDASGNSVAASIIGNALDNTIISGKGQNLTGGTGADVFFYSGGANVITDYTVADKDQVSIANNLNPVTDVASISASGNDLILNFGSGDTLTFTNSAFNISGLVPNVGVTVNGGGKTYIYNKNSIAEGYGLTLAAGYTGTVAASQPGYDVTQNITYNTIDGSAVTVNNGLVLNGNDAANYFIGSKTKSNSLYGGNGNDTLQGGDETDIFRYTAGKDVIDNYAINDKVSLDSSIITGAKVNAKDQLIFSTNNKDNTLTFNPVNDSVVEAVSLQSGGFLTKDGKVASDTLTLFTDTKGRVSVPSGDLYASVKGIDASAVTGNVVTMVGADGGTYTFASNKKADVFEYNGGAVSLSGYVADSDKIDLGDYTFTSFKSDSTGVSLNASTSGGTGTIVINGDYTKSEILLHDDIRDKRNQYSKVVFAADNVLQDKASKPTSATVFGGATEYRAGTTGGNSVKNITVDGRTTGASIYAGDINTNIDASAAGVGVSLFSGAKNDKFTGSKGDDLFVYSAGKDVISGYASGDSISLGSFAVDDITKISKSNKAITFKFDKNSNSLNVKSTSAIGTININGEDYTFGKKSTIIKGGVASLTSGFSGTYTADSSATSIIGSEVTKNLTIKGQKNIADYIVAGNGKKTKLQGQGGNDSLIGGSGSDTFFYKKGESGNISIKNFGAGDDNIKINGSKVIAENGLSTDTTKSLTITMANGAAITIDDFAPATGSTAETKTIKDILIKANNTAYWFDETYTPEGSSTAGGWVTSIDKISKSAMKNSGLAIVDLGYATNLVKAGLAYKDENVTLPSASSNGNNN